jgi:hypothetical protein
VAKPSRATPDAATTSEGAGLGNKFLANIREADAICQVIRAFTDPDVVHVDGKVSPADDIETINTELILADLQTIEKALPAVAVINGGLVVASPKSGFRRACGNPRAAAPLAERGTGALGSNGAHCAWDRVV